VERFLHGRPNHPLYRAGYITRVVVALKQSRACWCGVNSHHSPLLFMDWGVCGASRYARIDFTTSAGKIACWELGKSHKKGIMAQKWIAKIKACPTRLV